jgi:hypothetical protein
VAKEDPPAASTSLCKVFGSGLRSLAPLSNSQHSCFPSDPAPVEMKSTLGRMKSLKFKVVVMYWVVIGKVGKLALFLSYHFHAKL